MRRPHFQVDGQTVDVDQRKCRIRFGWSYGSGIVDRVRDPLCAMTKTAESSSARPKPFSGWAAQPKVENDTLTSCACRFYRAEVEPSPVRVNRDLLLSRGKLGGQEQRERLVRRWLGSCHPSEGAGAMTSRSTANSPLTTLQIHFQHPCVVMRLDEALQTWSSQDPPLAAISSHRELADALATRDYARHDEVLYALLVRAAESDDEGMTATEMVVNAMLPAVPGIVARVVRVARATGHRVGARRGVTGGGVSASEDIRDIQAAVIGHLWEQTRCYPLRRRHHVAANLVRETQRAAQRDFGVDHGQAAADVVSIDDDEVRRPLAAPPEEMDASEELLELLSWAVEHDRLDEQSATILITRYFGDPVGRDGVATDRQIGALIGLSQPTITRHRRRAFEQLAEAAAEFPGHELRRAS